MTTLCPSHKDMMKCFYYYYYYYSFFLFFGGTNHVGNVPFGHVTASELRASLQTVMVNMSSLTGSMLNSLLEVTPCVSYFARWGAGVSRCTPPGAFIKGCASEESSRSILAFPFLRRITFLWKHSAYIDMSARDKQD